jgi:hypothetical protein
MYHEIYSGLLFSIFPFPIPLLLGRGAFALVNPVQSRKVVNSLPKVRDNGSGALVDGLDGLRVVVDGYWAFVWPRDRLRERGCDDPKSICRKVGSP